MVISLVVGTVVLGSLALTTAGFNNLFKHETIAQMGKIFQYIWDDKENYFQPKTFNTVITVNVINLLK